MQSCLQNSVLYTAERQATESLLRALPASETCHPFRSVHIISLSCYSPPSPPLMQAQQGSLRLLKVGSLNLTAGDGKLSPSGT